VCCRPIDIVVSIDEEGLPNVHLATENDA
jgi:hypothetical protein